MTDEVTDAMTVDNINIWGIKDMPSFEGWKAFVLPGAFYGQCVALFAKAGFERAVSVEEADVVVFIGGVDVNPELYGEAPIVQTQMPSPARDNLEIEVYNKCVELGKPMFGICRGAQFLHVMNKGTLWQHVEGHAGPDHYIYDIEDDCLVMATSLHHQMLALNNNIDVVAVCKDQVSRKFHSADMVLDLDREGANASVEIEIEAGIYWETRCFFVQGHPEVGSEEYQSWAMHKFWDFTQELVEIHGEEVAPDPLDEELARLQEEDEEMTFKGLYSH
jgi:GMP synthase-like glutamine amidotransferase